jgi:hypothetical protein
LEYVLEGVEKIGLTTLGELEELLKEELEDLLVE